MVRQRKLNRSKGKDATVKDVRGSEGYPWRGRSIRKFRAWKDGEGDDDDESEDKSNIELASICIIDQASGSSASSSKQLTPYEIEHRDREQTSNLKSDPLYCPIPNRGKTIRRYRESQTEQLPQSTYCNEAYEGDGVYNNYASFDNAEDIELENLDTSETQFEDFDEDAEIVNSLKRNLPSRRSKSRGSIRVSPQDEGYKPVDTSAEGADEIIPMGSLPKRRMSEKDIHKTIKRMPVSIEEKKKARSEVKMREEPGRKGRKTKDERKTISIWVEYRSSFAMKVRRIYQNIKQALSSFHIWQSHMKTVQGIFGTGVLSYFTFLRWLVYFNVFISALVICFLLIPQTFFSRSYEDNSKSFNGLELLTGEGWFTESELYYGEYTNKEINNKYNMQFAYLFVGCGYILLCLVILVVSIGRQYKENYIIGGESFTRFSSKVFCSWDYTISSKDTAQLKQQSIFRDILENVGPQQVDDRKTLRDRCNIIGLRVATWFISLSISVFSIWLIVYISEKSVNKYIGDPNSQSVFGMLPAIVISVINIVIPPVFRMIALLERYNASVTAVNVTLFRTILLQLGSVVVYIIYLYIEIKNKKEYIQEKNICWETAIGQVFYKLVIIDFIATMISTFLNEFVRNIVSKYCECCQEYKPGFDISKNVLNLIYAQGIVWLGTFFAPLLPLMNVLKLIIVFYVKRISVTQNCKPSVKPFKASRMNVLFRLLLSIMLIFTCIVIGVVVLDSGFISPSKHCGPFRNETSIYRVVTKTIDTKVPKELKKAIKIITSWVVIAALIMILILLAHYFRLKKNTTAQKIEGLKYQLTLASQDKQFLIRQIRDMIKNAPTGATGTLPLQSTLVKEKVT